MVLVVAFIGFSGIAGVGHSLLRELTDHRLRTIEDVQASTGLDRAVTVHEVKTQAWKMDHSVSEHLQPAYTKVSICAYDAMAKLAVRLRDRQTHQNGWIIGVAAPTEGAGTSLIAAHLARIIAESGQRTILLDANWQKTAADQEPPSPGQSQKLAKAFATMGVEAGALDVLVLRATTPISELNASLSIKSTLDLLRADYECIIVDFHAGDLTADLEAALAVTDRLIIVAEAVRTTWERLCGFLRYLPRNNIAAIILNRSRKTERRS